MKPIRKNRIIGVIFVLFFCMAIATSCYAATINDVLKSYHAQFSIPKSFTILKDFKHPAKEKNFHTLIAEDREKKTRMEIEIIRPFSPEDAANYSRQQYKVIKGLYGPRTISYPGAVTRPSSCPEDKKPKEVTVDIAGKHVIVLLANASDRYVFGVWDDDIIKQRGAFAVFYDDRTKTYYQIILFQPAESFNEAEVLTILKSLQTI